MFTTITNNRIAVVAYIVLVCVTSGYTWACSCGSGSSHEVAISKRFNSTDVVFTGIVESIKEAPENYTEVWEFEDEEDWVIPAVEVRINVEDGWKGKLEKQVAVYTMDHRSNNCGYDFKEKGRYTVFANFKKNSEQEESDDSNSYLWTSWCHHNIDFSEVEDENEDRLKELFEELKIEHEQSEDEPEDLANDKEESSTPL